MGRMDVSRAIRFSLGYMVSVMFKPFVFKKWLAWGFIAALAGSFAYSPANLPGSYKHHSTNKSAYSASQYCSHTQGAGTVQTAHAHHKHQNGLEQLTKYFKYISKWLPLIIPATIILWLLFTWLYAVFNLVYVNNLVTNTYAIKEPFARLKGLGKSFFLWSLAYTGVFFTIVGIFRKIAFSIPKDGWWERMLHNDTSLHCKLFFAGFLVAAFIVDLFARGFVLPVMYVRGIKVIEGWKTVIPILHANAKQVMLYLLFSIAAGLVAEFILCLAIVTAVMLMIIPGVIFLLIGFLASMAFCGSADTASIVSSVITCPVLLFGAMCITEAILQPVEVFLRTIPIILLGQANSSLAAIHIPPYPEKQE